MKRRANNHLQTQAISRIALFSAINILFLSLVRISPVADLVFLTLTSLCVAMVLVLGNHKEAVFSWLITSLISLIFPGWLFAWPFYVFFGLYPILKSKIECFARDRKKYCASCNFVLKTIVALGLAALCLWILHLLVPNWFELFAERLPLQIGRGGQIALMITLTVLVFFVYDYALTVLIDYVQRRFRRSRG